MRKYKRVLALLLCAAMAGAPCTALAAGAGAQPEEPVSPEDSFEALFDGDAQLTEPLLPMEDPAAEATPPAFTESTAAEAPETDVPAAEAEDALELPHENAVWINYNGQLLELETFAIAISGTTYVPVRDFFEALGCTVEWNSRKQTVTVTRGTELEAVFTLNSRLARANLRCWYMDQPCILLDGSAMVPVRAAAKIFNAEVVWDGENQAVHLTGSGVLESGLTYYDDEADSLLWLARIIYHESGNQPLDGKVAVGNVVMNRVNNPIFPDTVYDVLYDNRTGVQFLKQSNTKIFKEPNEESWLAAKLVMEGYVTAPGCLYFASVRLIKTCWAAKNRTYYASIGAHAFWQ